MQGRRSKCSRVNHVFEGGRKCICGKGDLWYFICYRCKVKHVAKYNYLPCDDCLKSAEYKKEKAEVESSYSSSKKASKSYREPTAFGYDRKTGRPWALDRYGKKFDPKETRYDLERDRHGWGATGKIPKKRNFIYSK